MPFQILFHLYYGPDGRSYIVFRDPVIHFAHNGGTLYIVSLTKLSAVISQDDSLLSLIIFIWLKYNETLLFQLQKDLLYILMGAAKYF